MGDDAARVRALELFAWVGDDESGRGGLGLKQALVPAGYVPLVATDRDRIAAAYIREQLARIADVSGKSRYLVRLGVVEVLDVIDPDAGAGSAAGCHGSTY
jgi:hypothetical protein